MSTPSWRRSGFRLLRATQRSALLDWSGRGDLNARPPAPKAGALPGCATPRLSTSLILKCFPWARKRDPLAKLEGNALDFSLTAQKGPFFFGDPEVFVVSRRVGPNKSGFRASEGHASARPCPGSTIFFRA